MDDLRNDKARTRDAWLESLASIPKQAADSARGLYLRNRLEAAFCAGYDAGEKVRARIRTSSQQGADMTIPAEPNPFAGAQNWRDMDGADAWLVINRNANGWSEVRMMMEAWRDAAAPSPPSGWLAIESAPRDRYVLLSNFRSVFVGLYRTEESSWVDARGGLRDPSRWMPLPPPPEDRT